MRRTNKLTAAKVSKVQSAGMYGDGDGLWLQVREIEGGLSKAWIFRFMFAGRARYMGLGPLRQVPLAKARARAEEARDLIYAGASRRSATSGTIQEQRMDRNLDDEVMPIVSSEGSGG